MSSMDEHIKHVLGQKERAKRGIYPPYKPEQKEKTKSTSKKPVPLPVPSPSEQLQAGWDAEMEARQSPEFRYAGKSLSEVDAARGRAKDESDRASRAAAWAENNYSKSFSSDFRQNLNAESRIGVAKQASRLASKRNAELEKYFNTRVQREYNKKQTEIKNRFETEYQNDPGAAFQIERALNNKSKFSNEATIAQYATNPAYRIAMTVDRARSGGDRQDLRNLEYLNDLEKNTLLYLIGKGNNYKEYLESLNLDARRQRQESAWTKEFSYEHPIIGGVGNILAMPAEPLAYLANAGQTIKNTVTGEYEPTNRNSTWFTGAHIGQDTAEGVTEKAYDSAYNATGNEAAANAASFLAGAGMSIGRVAATLPLGGAGNIGSSISLGLQSSAAAGSSTLDALERGATPQQAFAAGTLSGAIEYLTERIPTNRIFKLAESSDKLPLRKTLANILKQSGIEGTEESISNIAGNIADQVIMGDKSNYELLVSQLIQQGMSREEAEKQAFTQLYVVDTLKSAAGGALSGGVMGAGASMVGMARGRSAQNTAKRAIDNAYNVMNENGLFGDGVRNALDRAHDARLVDRGINRGYTEPQGVINNEETNTITDSRTGEAVAATDQPGADTGGKNGYRGRWDGRKALYTGEQSATNNGQLRETQIRDQSQSGARWKTGYSESGGQAVYTSDSEGREIGEQQFEQLRNTAIRTPEGRPIAVYHSTPNMDFTEFAKGDTGFHFGNEAQAQKRGRDKNIENGRMFRAYLDIKNPIYVKSDIMNWKPYALSFRLYNDGIINQSEYDKIQSLTAEGQDYDSPASVELRRLLESKGYDGIIYPNAYEAGDSYMAFRPDQIITTDIYNIANGKIPSINHQAFEQSGAFSMPENAEQNTGHEPNQGEKFMDNSVGAMVHDPNSYSALQGKYGTIPPGENPARVVDVPRQTSDDTRTRQFVRTAMESETTPDEFIPDLEEMVRTGEFAYTPESNQKSIREALKKIRRVGFDAAVSEFRAKVDGNERIKPEDLALGELILAEAGRTKNFDLARQTFLDLAVLFTESGRNIQIVSALKKMGPSGRYYTMSKLVERINNRLLKEGRLDVNQEAGKDMMNLVSKASEKAVYRAAKDIENISVEEWSSKVGELLSNTIDTKKTEKAKTSIENVLHDLKKFSRFYPKTQQAHTKKRSYIDMLRDYYANKSLYQSAWKEAQDKLREKYKNDKESLDTFNRFINSTLEYSGSDEQVSIIGMAINEIIKEKYQNKKNFNDQVALGLTDTKTIEHELIDALGVSEEDARQVRDAVQRYFFTAQNVTNPHRIATMIQAASKKLGETFNKVLTKKSFEKSELLQRIQNHLVESYHFSDADAEIAANTIEKEFYNLLEINSKQSLRSRLKEKDAPNVSEKNAMSMLEKYLNLGALSNSDFSDAAMKKITGYDGIVVPDELLQQYANAKTDAESDAALAEIEKSIGEQIPADVFDKIDGFRYLSMLFNPLTHIRNIAGNTVGLPVRSIQNIAQTVLERTIPKESGNRTAALKTSKEMRDFAEESLGAMLEISSSKYNDTNSRINNYRKIFKTKWLEKLRKFNFNLMEKEDAFAKKHAFKLAFARMAKANGWTVEFLKSGTPEADTAMQRLVSHATDKALESTFQEANALADIISRTKTINRAKFKDGNLAQKAGQIGKSVAMNAVLPFAKTTMNISKQSARYSGATLLFDVYEMASNIRKAGKNARTKGEAVQMQQEALAKGIDKISGGVTGVGLAVVGWLLSSLGLLRVEGDDENKNTFEELQGHQNYALELENKKIFGVDIPNVSISLTWANPFSAPLFVGAELQNYFEQREDGEDADIYGVFEALSHVLDPITEMSFMQGASDLFKSVAYAKDNPVSAILQNLATSYARQFVPSLLRNTAKVFDDTRRTTYSGFETGIEKNLKQNLGRKIVSGLPIASKTLEPYVDAWGREDITKNPAVRFAEAFVQPWYQNTINKTPVDSEIERLVSKTSDDSLYPNRAPTSVQFGDDRYYLTPKELTEYQKTMGQTAYSEINKLINNSNYKSLTSSEQANVIRKVYEYSKALADKNLYDSHKQKKDVGTLIDSVNSAKKVGISSSDFFVYREKIGKEIYVDGKQKSDETKKYLMSLLPEEMQRDIKNTTKDEEASDLRRMYILSLDIPENQKEFLDSAIVSNKPTVVDYGSEDAFYFSQLSESKQNRYRHVPSRWDNITKKEYYNIIDACRGLETKDDIVARLKEIGFSTGAAYSFYTVIFSSSKKWK